jgi:hypothetical protein
MALQQKGIKIKDYKEIDGIGRAISLSFSFLENISSLFYKAQICVKK